MSNCLLSLPIISCFLAIVNYDFGRMCVASLLAKLIHPRPPLIPVHLLAICPWNRTTTAPTPQNPILFPPYKTHPNHTPLGSNAPQLLRSTLHTHVHEPPASQQAPHSELTDGVPDPPGVHGAAGRAGAGVPGGPDPAGDQAAVGPRRRRGHAVLQLGHPPVPRRPGQAGRGPGRRHPGGPRQGARPLLPARRPHPRGSRQEARRRLRGAGRHVRRRRRRPHGGRLRGRAEPALPLLRAVHTRGHLRRRRRARHRPTLALHSGDEAQVRRLHLRAAVLPLRRRRARRHGVREGHLRAGPRRGGTLGTSSMGQGDVHGAGSPNPVLPAPRVQRPRGRRRPDALHPGKRHVPRALLLRPTRDRGAAAARAAARGPHLPVRAGGGLHLAGPHGGARVRRRRGGAPLLHRQRAGPPRRAAPGRLLRQRLRLLRGGHHGRGAVRGRAGLRAGAGEEGQVGGHVRLPAVRGGPDGAPRPAPVRARKDVHRLRRQPRRVQERRLRVGRARVRRAGQGRRGAVARRDQLLLQVQEREGGGRHRGAHLPAQGRHGEVPARGRRPHRRDLDWAHIYTHSVQRVRGRSIKVFCF